MPAQDKSGQWTSPLLQERQNSAKGVASWETNEGLIHALDMVKSEASRVDGQLSEDFSAILRGNCIYHKNFICDESDRSLYDSMKRELAAYSGEDLSQNGLINWSKHQLFENPTNVSATFNIIVEAMAEYFDVEVYATRLNYYRDGSEWKPFHHDSHAYGGKALREDITLGVSLGATRALQFLHEPSKKTFSFPQANGDVFCFTNEVNTKFMHAVPRAPSETKDRFSVIVWGRRKSINERNGGPRTNTDQRLRNVHSVDDAVAAAQAMVSVTASGRNTDQQKSVVKKKNRLQ